MWNWISLIHPNQVTILSSLIGAITAILAAFLAFIFGIPQALRPVKEQFQHKVIHNGWREFQEKLFEFSSKFSTYSLKVLNLKYFLDSQNNKLINKGDKDKFRLDKWNEMMQSYQDMQFANVEFLRSFETHEVIFKSLKKMKSLFQKVIREKIDDAYFNFYEAIFPEMYGTKNSYTVDELKQKIQKYWEDIVTLENYLIDFRIELQNETVGKILGRKIDRRKPDKGYLILTRKGFITQKRQPKRNPEDL